VDDLMKPYQIISCVWHARLGLAAPQSRVIPNPNAAAPLSAEDADVLAKTPPRGA